MAYHHHPELAPDSEIKAFWTWFQGISSELGVDFDNQPLLAKLDARVSRLGDVLWEIGPGQKEENALVITPDGSREWLSATQHIVELAPVVTGWEFHSSRPARKWDLQFSIESVSGSAVEVDAREWRYVLYKFPDGDFDIVLEQSNLVGVEESDRYMAAVVLLDGIIGESKRLELIRSIESIATIPEGDAAKANPIKVFAKHLISLQTGN